MTDQEQQAGATEKNGDPNGGSANAMAEHSLSEPAPTKQLKTLLQAGLVDHFVHGQEICHIAPGQPVPSGAAAFDSIVALDVLTHVPDWPQRLREWQGRLSAGGRILFDVHSRDNLHAAFGPDSESWPEPLRNRADSQAPEHFILHIGLEELLAFADKAGMTVLAAVPYGAFLGGNDSNWLLYQALERTFKWKRALSWFARDPALIELGLFLEEQLVSRLTPRMAGRLFVVLENRADHTANTRLAADLSARDEALSQYTFDKLQPWLPLTPQQYAGELDRLLQPLRARHFFFLLLQVLHAHVPSYDFADALSDEMMQVISAWLTAAEVDSQVMVIARQWSAPCEFKLHQGVDVTLGMQYDLVRVLLAKHYGVFGEAPQ